MNRKSQRGFASLLSVVIAAAIVLILLAGLAPATIRATQSIQEEAAATVLARINYAEHQALNLYGGYMSPQALAVANPSLPLSACNPELLAGQDAQQFASRGYAFAWAPATGGIPATGCTNNPPTVYTGYSVTAQPISPLSGDRYFYADSSDLVYMNPGEAITAPDPTKVYAINVLGGAVNSSGAGNNNNSNGSAYKGTWSPTASYHIGDEVLRSPAAINGEQGPVGIYFNLSGGNAEDPATPGNTDWSGFAYGITPVGYSLLSGSAASSNPVDSRCVSGSPSEFTVTGTHDIGCPVLSSLTNPQNVGGSATYSTFSVSTGSGAPFTVDAVVLLHDVTTGAYIGCYAGPANAPADLPTPASATSCSYNVNSGTNGWAGNYENTSGIPNGECSSSGFTVGSSDNLQIIVLDLANLAPYNVTISWQLQ